mgnify:CR=1 FL=1
MKTQNDNSNNIENPTCVEPLLPITFAIEPLSKITFDVSLNGFYKSIGRTNINDIPIKKSSLNE